MSSGLRVERSLLDSTTALELVERRLRLTDWFAAASLVCSMLVATLLLLVLLIAVQVTSVVLQLVILAFFLGSVFAAVIVLPGLRWIEVRTPVSQLEPNLRLQVTRAFACSEQLRASHQWALPGAVRDHISELIGAVDRQLQLMLEAGPFRESPDFGCLALAAAELVDVQRSQALAESDGMADRLARTNQLTQQLSGW